MQFTGKLTEADLNDVRKLARTKMYWVKFVAVNWYGTLLLIAVSWGTIAGLLGKTTPNWPAIGLIWFVIVGFFGWAFYRTKRANERQFTQLNAQLPDQISFTNDGVKLDGPNGATGLLPWRNFKGWREGQRVVLVDQLDGNRTVILPVAQMSEIERLPIRQFLQTHIPQASL